MLEKLVTMIPGLKTRAVTALIAGLTDVLAGAGFMLSLIHISEPTRRRD